MRPRGRGELARQILQPLRQVRVGATCCALAAAATPAVTVMVTMVVTAMLALDRLVAVAVVAAVISAQRAEQFVRKGACGFLQVGAAALSRPARWHRTALRRPLGSAGSVAAAAVVAEACPLLSPAISPCKRLHHRADQWVAACRPIAAVDLAQIVVVALVDTVVAAGAPQFDAIVACLLRPRRRVCSSARGGWSANASERASNRTCRAPDVPTEGL